VVVGDGGTVVAEQLIARIDTEGKAGAAAPAAPRCGRWPRLRPAAAAAPLQPVDPRAGVAMPAAAKLMADNNLAPARWPAPARMAA
jgi:2-oxoglutarate dehydrogenase E2 component (dihydrolipoamide succinyltransferase)